MNNGNDGQLYYYYYYATAERSRSVTLVPRDAVVSDVESITEFQFPASAALPNQVTAWNRTAVYLRRPTAAKDLLWQPVGGQAVAFFGLPTRTAAPHRPWILCGNAPWRDDDAVSGNQQQQQLE